MQIFFLPIETYVKFCDFKIYFDLQIFLKYILNLFFSVIMLPSIQRKSMVLAMLLLD